MATKSRNLKTAEEHYCSASRVWLGENARHDQYSQKIRKLTDEQLIQTIEDESHEYAEIMANALQVKRKTNQVVRSLEKLQREKRENILWLHEECIKRICDIDDVFYTRQSFAMSLNLPKKKPNKQKTKEVGVLKK